MGRKAAAEAAGRERQTLRDWVHRFNEACVDILKDRPRSDRPPPRISQQAALRPVILGGPDAERDGVSSWREGENHLPGHRRLTFTDGISRRQIFDATMMSLKTMRRAVRWESGCFVRTVRWRTVTKTLSIGFEILE